jgi:hypothetical protein
VRTKVKMMTAPNADHIEFDVLAHVSDAGETYV